MQAEEKKIEIQWIQDNKFNDERFSVEIKTKSFNSFKKI